MMVLGTYGYLYRALNAFPINSLITFSCFERFVFFLSKGTTKSAKFMLKVISF
jgi:hypothetical protein